MVVFRIFVANYLPYSKTAMYNAEPDKEDIYAKKIKTLLESTDFENVELAFQILKGQGMNPQDQELAWLMTNHPRKVLKCLEYDFLFLVADSIEYLNLQGLNLSQLPENIISLQKLKHLYLHHNNLQKLPESITDLKFLEHITLGANPSLNMAHTLKVLSKIINLKELYFFDAEILYLTADVGNFKSLEVLDLGQNKLKTLPQDLTRLQHLKKLKIDQNLFSVIPPVLYKLKNLKELHLTNNSFIEKAALENLKKVLSQTIIYFD